MGKGERAVRTLIEAVVLLTLLGTYIGITILVCKRREISPSFYGAYFYLATGGILICIVIFWLQGKVGFSDMQVGGLLLSVVRFYCYYMEC